MNSTFLTNESGAVTVDWVVLTAALVGLGLAAMAVVSGGVSALSGDVDTQLVNQGITSEFADAGSSILDMGVISWHHSQAWLDDVVPNYFGDPNDFTEAELIAYHGTMADTINAANPADITSGHYHNSIDHFGAVEAAMADRGIDVPQGGLTYTEARAAYDANPV